MSSFTPREQANKINLLRHQWYRGTDDEKCSEQKIYQHQRIILLKAKLQRATVAKTRKMLH